MNALETEEHLILAGVIDNGGALDEGQCRRLFDILGMLVNTIAIPSGTQSLLADATARRQNELLVAMSSKNGEWFDIEMDKLDRWAEDLRTSLKSDLEELDQSIKDAKKSARLAPNLHDSI